MVAIAPQNRKLLFTLSKTCRSALTSTERKDYTAGVKCLMKLPSIIPKEAAPGVESRYDDFTATHINNTLLIHVNGVFLGESSPWRLAGCLASLHHR